MTLKPLNDAVFGNGQLSIQGKRPINVEDIAKCQSGSFFARLIGQVKTKLETGQFITEGTVKEILRHNNYEKLGTISTAFKSTLPNARAEDLLSSHDIKPTHKELKIAAALGGIFHRIAANEMNHMSRSNPDTASLKQLQNNALDAKIILQARIQLEKYDPATLLRAAVFENGNEGSANLKHDFIQFLIEKQPPIQNETELKAAYKEFTETSLNSFNAQPFALKEKIQEYGKNALNSYYVALSAQDSGLGDMDIQKPKNFDELYTAAIDMHKSIQLNEKLDQFEKETLGNIEPRLLDRLLKDEEVARPILLAASQKGLLEENVAFATAVLDARKLPPGNERSLILQEIKKTFVDTDTDEETWSTKMAPLNINSTSIKNAFIAKMEANPDDIEAFIPLYEIAIKNAAQLKPFLESAISDFRGTI